MTKKTIKKEEKKETKKHEEKEAKHEESKERVTRKRGEAPVIKSGGSRRCYFCKANKKIVSKRYYNVGNGAQQKVMYLMECGHFDHD